MATSSTEGGLPSPIPGGSYSKSTTPIDDKGKGKGKAPSDKVEGLKSKILVQSSPHTTSSSSASASSIKGSVAADSGKQIAKQIATMVPVAKRVFERNRFEGQTIPHLDQIAQRGEHISLPSYSGGLSPIAKMESDFLVPAVALSGAGINTPEELKDAVTNACKGVMSYISQSMREEIAIPANKAIKELLTEDGRANSIIGVDAANVEETVITMSRALTQRIQILEVKIEDFASPETAKQYEAEIMALKLVQIEILAFRTNISTEGLLPMVKKDQALDMLRRAHTAPSEGQEYSNVKYRADVEKIQAKQATTGALPLDWLKDNFPAAEKEFQKLPTFFSAHDISAANRGEAKVLTTLKSLATSRRMADLSREHGISEESASSTTFSVKQGAEIGNEVRAMNLLEAAPNSNPYLIPKYLKALDAIDLPGTSSKEYLVSLWENQGSPHNSTTRTAWQTHVCELHKLQFKLANGGNESTLTPRIAELEGKIAELGAELESQVTADSMVTQTLFDLATLGADSHESQYIVVNGEMWGLDCGRWGFPTCTAVTDRVEVAETISVRPGLSGSDEPGTVTIPEGGDVYPVLRSGHLDDPQCLRPVPDSVRERYLSRDIDNEAATARANGLMMTPAEVAPLKETILTSKEKLLSVKKTHDQLSEVMTAMASLPERAEAHRGKLLNLLEAEKNTQVIPVWNELSAIAENKLDITPPEVGADPTESSLQLIAQMEAKLQNRMDTIKELQSERETLLQLKEPADEKTLQAFGKKADELFSEFGIHYESDDYLSKESESYWEYIESRVGKTEKLLDRVSDFRTQLDNILKEADQKKETQFAKLDRIVSNRRETYQHEIQQKSQELRSLSEEAGVPFDPSNPGECLQPLAKKLENDLETAQFQIYQKFSPESFDAWVGREKAIQGLIRDTPEITPQEIRDSLFPEMAIFYRVQARMRPNPSGTAAVDKIGGDFVERITLSHIIRNAASQGVATKAELEEMVAQLQKMRESSAPKKDMYLYMTS